jgi:hypothetical protein
MENGSLMRDEVLLLPYFVYSAFVENMMRRSESLKGNGERHRPVSAGCYLVIY